MANNENRDNILADLMEITIDGDRAPFYARVSIGTLLTTHAAKAARTGEDIIRTLIIGRGAEIEIEWVQATSAELALFLQTAGSAPRKAVDAGTALTQHTLLVHPVAAGATTTGDLFFYAVTWPDPFEMESDGREEARFITRGTAERDANGDVWRRGAGT